MKKTTLKDVEIIVCGNSRRIDDVVIAVTQNADKIDRNAQAIDRNAAAIAVNADKIDRNAAAIAVNAEKIDVNTNLLDRLAIHVTQLVKREEFQRFQSHIDRQFNKMFVLMDGMAGNQKKFDAELAANQHRTDRLEKRVEVLEEEIMF